MSAITTRRPPAPKSPAPEPLPDNDFGDQRIVIRGVDWDLYDRLSDAIGEGQHVRVAFDGNDLELMSTSIIHENYKVIFGQFLGALIFELAIRAINAGETTWKRVAIARGLEADHSFYFHPEKLGQCEAGIRLESYDVDDYPNPDLAVEIDVSRSQVDRPGIYAALRVEEVWRFNGQSVVIGHLQPDGTYAPAESSRFLPIRASEVFRWIAEEDTIDRLAWERRLRDGIRAELAPRLNPPPTT